MLFNYPKIVFVPSRKLYLRLKSIICKKKMVEIDYVLARKLFQIGATIIFVFQAKESIRFETGLWSSFKQLMLQI